jgi:hypothetical protein
MPKSCSRIAGGVLVIATAGSAAAQISTLNELEAALLDCWEPPPIEQSRPGTQITVLISFKRNGELFEQPRITFQSGDPSDAERTSYRTLWRRRSSAARLWPSRRRSETPWPVRHSPSASSMIGSRLPTRRSIFMNLVGCGEAAFPAAARTDRPELAKVIRRFDAGDVLVVTRLTPRPPP